LYGKIGYGNHVNSERDADNVHKALLYLDRMINYDYHDNVFKHHDKNRGQMKMEFKDSEDGRSFLDITRSNIKTEEDKIKEHKEYRRLAEIVEKQEVQDYEIFFDHLKKHIRSWWD
jgi:nitrogenase subunit NifH